MSGNAAAVLTKPGFRKIEWLKRDIDVERRPDGVIILKSRIPLQSYEKHIPASLPALKPPRLGTPWEIMVKCCHYCLKNSIKTSRLPNFNTKRLDCRPT